MTHVIYIPLRIHDRKLQYATPSGRGYSLIVTETDTGNFYPLGEGGVGSKSKPILIPTTVPSEKQDDYGWWDSIVASSPYGVDANFFTEQWNAITTPFHKALNGVTFGLSTVYQSIYGGAFCDLLTFQNDDPELISRIYLQVTWIDGELHVWRNPTRSPIKPSSDAKELRVSEGTWADINYVYPATSGYWGYWEKATLPTYKVIPALQKAIELAGTIYLDRKLKFDSPLALPEDFYIKEDTIWIGHKHPVDGTENLTLKRVKELFPDLVNCLDTLGNASIDEINAICKMHRSFQK